MSVLERLKKIYLESAGCDASDVSFTVEATLVEDLGLNSVALLYLARSVEEEFDVSFSNSDLESLKTVGDVIAAIERLSK